MALPPPTSFNPAPIQSGWGNDAKTGPASVWALWFQSLCFPYDTYVTLTNIAHTGTLTKSMSITKSGRVVTVIVTYSDTTASVSTVGTTTFSLPYKPISKAVVTGINATTFVSLPNGFVSTDGNLYSPTATTGPNQVIVLTTTYFI